MYHCSRLLFSALLIGATAVSIGCIDRALGDLPDTTENARPASVQPLAAAEPIRFNSGPEFLPRRIHLIYFRVVGAGRRDLEDVGLSEAR
jgi:hypothetical protein